MTTEQELKELRSAVITSRSHIEQMAKSAVNIAKDFALKSVCGGTNEKVANVEMAKHWNSRAEAFQETLRLLP
jgi:hypothetical protein